jgi:hypothetical protein
MVRIHFACYGKVLSSLHTMAQTHLDPRTRFRAGQALRFAPLLSAFTRKAVGGRSRRSTSLRRSKGIPVSQGVRLTTIPNSVDVHVRTCQSAGVSVHRIVRTCPTVRRVTGS